MKKIFITTFLMLFILLNTSTQAQKKETPPENASWQLVSNINDKSKVTVQFFTANGVLMYEETLHNVKLNLAKKKTMRRLNAVLKQVYDTWVINKTKAVETDLIARSLNP